MKIIVEFDLNEPQLESAKRLAKSEPGWHYCDLIIRHNGKDIREEGDFIRAFYKEIRKLNK